MDKVWQAWGETNCIPGLVRKSEGQRALGKPVFRTENNIGGPKEMWCEEMECVYLAQNRKNWWIFLKMTVNNRFPHGVWEVVNS